MGKDQLLNSRARLIERAASGKYELVIIGGGIHGATAARIAAYSGIRTLLLEQADYASQTSSRSSKMAHGGLRYLEMFDFQQVFEGVKSREKLYRDHPDLVRPYPFYIPIPKADWLFRLKLKAGLTLYDLFVQDSERRHSWVTQQKAIDVVPELAGDQLAGCFQYFDGIMADSKLVVDNILQARDAGADCLNYAQVNKLSGTTVQWQDNLNPSQLYSTQAETILNCAGPWADQFAPENSLYQHKFSRGAHVIFNVPWDKPALFLPMPGKSRYYFIWPHPAGTMVGTTEREVSEAELDPLPSRSEISEIYDRLARDLPTANLNQHTAHYAFAGLRSLPLKKKKQSTATARISRKHHWQEDKNIFSLYGGKYTTAEWTAAEGVQLIQKKLGRNSKLALESKPLAAPPAKLSEQFIAEQVFSVPDYLSYRTDLIYRTDYGLGFIEDNYHQLAELFSDQLLDQQLARYKETLAEVKSRLV